jgi:hypothetical protein
MVDDGEMFMLPPTYVTCAELFEYVDTESALAAAEHRDLTPIRPSAVKGDGGVFLSIPDRLVRVGREVSARIRG